MCGICGAYNLTGEMLSDWSVLRTMCTAMTHRGPDDEGFYVGGGIFMGMRRLSIIDLAGGQQPIWNEDHTCCIVYNGELYNFLDLRPELEACGHRFRTRSDTEVILHSYEQWGPECSKHFNGMFAFAIWDNRGKRLLLARDRIGEKPLYYYRDNERFIFASEIKAILADPSVPRQINLQGLANFLAFGHAVAPETIYQNISKLLPGHYLLIRDGQIQITQYWDVGEDQQVHEGAALTEGECAEHVLALLDDSVRRRMIADVPVGAFLSGGVDSSAVVALMKRHATGALKTFSLGFSINGAFNELKSARQVAKDLGTDHYELETEHVDLVQTLRTLVYHYDEPFGDAANFPVYLLSRFAREQVKVVLTGDGGDELFGGYRRYTADQAASLYQRLPNSFTKLLPKLVGYFPRLRRIKRSLQTLPITDPARRYASWLVLFNPDLQSELLHSDLYLANYDPAGCCVRYYRNLNSEMIGDHLNRLMYVDLKTRLVDAYMEKTDKATMAHGLEARLPLLDHRLVELAFQIPSRYKIRGWSTKRIFKQAVSSLVAPSVLRRPKHGFAVPTDPWFRGVLKSFAFEVLLDERTRRQGYFNTPMVERLWREHVEGRNAWDTHLWLLLNLELWRRIYLDHAHV